MRGFRSTALGAALLAVALLAAACGGGSGGGGGGGGGGGTVAGQLTLGGPPECPERPFCIPGLKDTYGVEFGEFKPLDVGGPLTVEALRNGDIDVGLLFSTSSVIGDEGWVVLEDDKNLQNAENITPVVRTEVLDDAITERLNAISAALTTENITALNGRVEIDGEDPADVATDFLQQQGLLGGATGSGDLTVGAVAFAENQIVAEMYAQSLEDAGYTVDRQTTLESREALQPALESGDVDIAPEYLSSLLLFLDPEATATGDPDANRSLLEPLLADAGQTLLDSSEANDTNSFVVTQETADQYSLVTMSDLRSQPRKSEQAMRGVRPRGGPPSLIDHPYASRSPARIGSPNRLSGGASGHAQ
jgi:osmoprotectant transport system substrate-binding protein